MNSLLVKNSITSFLTSVLSIPIGIISSIVVARVLGPSGKGSLDLISATAGIFGMALGLSIPSGIIYVTARGELSVNKLLKQLFLIVFLQVLAAAILLLYINNTKLSKAFIPAGVGRIAVFFIVVILMLNAIIAYLRSFLIGKQQIVRINGIDIANKIAYLIFLLAVLFLSFFGLRTANLLLIIWGNIGLSLFFIIIYLHHIKPLLTQRSDEGSGLKAIIKFSVPCYFGNLTQYLNYRLDVFIVSYFIGTVGLGLYSLAVSIGQMIWLISTAFATALLPMIASSPDNKPTRNVERTAQISRLTLLASCISAIGLACLSPLIPWVYGESFRQSILPLLWILPGIVLFTTVNILASYFAGIGKPKINLYVAMVSVIFTILLDLLLIPWLGIIGASITSTISYSLSAILSLVLFVRETHISLDRVLIVKREDLEIIIRIIGNLFKSISMTKETE